MSRKLSDKEQSNTFAWIAWFHSAHRDEFDRFLRYGTPSDKMVEIANEYKLLGSPERWVILPYSLNTSKGQKALWRATEKYIQWKRMIPVLAHETLQTVANELAATRRIAAARANALYVAEAILYRCAAEFTNQVIFSYDLIAAWISKAYNIRYDAMTVQRALKFWENVEGSPFVIVERGVKGNTSKATKIRVNLVPISTSNRYPRECIVSNTSLDTWLDYNAHAMEYVYKLQGMKADEYKEIRVKYHAKKMVEQAEKLLEATNKLTAATPRVEVFNPEQPSESDEEFWIELDAKWQDALIEERKAHLTLNDDEIIYERLLRQ